MSTSVKPIAIFYEHQEWFKPLFNELDQNEIPYVSLDAARHTYDITAQEIPYSLFFNRMSPSAYLRNNENGIFYTLSLLAHLESKGIPVVNGYKAFQHETSKALQLSLLEKLGLPYPKSRVINHASQAIAAAEGLRYPIVVKANIGGSGAGITRFDSPEELALAVSTNQISLGIDHTALVQEYITARDGHINRVETLGGKYLYAIKVYTDGESFNLCPADICQTTGGKELVRNACAIDAPKNGMRVEAYTPPQDVIDAIEKIVQEAGIDVGGIEYMVDDRDGQLYYYDVNALSNFVADAVNVIGFNPHARLAEYLVTKAELKLEEVK
ncbi:glutathione synthase/RimK-type ligase-like ATP-grasp enzyme [Pontibacter aydingkolensis]|uniref:ATP-grasp domain-containing protein n=1 Tax=Pontibacter aydingkolensis TaxID=1911536 RepID=A0ABS7CZ19_9BACT|nr:ATP-grasp domain-containing protein [Pontibacter aydingkolensis]MBW7469118.1 ATP-grasp domain-containing protein [Pontibacter aydingkolensis]